MSKKQKLELTWIGKDNRASLEPRILLEDKDKSYHAKTHVTDHDMFDNRLIFGDNLLALKALEQEFAGKVKCIFIDPPYNTGSAFTHYDDGVEHSTWLSLMRDRLELLRRLLSADGSLWITIDDNECHYLKVLCDEIFGRNNFVQDLAWEKVFASKNSSQYFSENHDHVLVYAKEKLLWKRNLLPRGNSSDSDYKNPDDDPRGLWISVALSARNSYSLGLWSTTAPSGRPIDGPPKGRYWTVSPTKFKELCDDNRISEEAGCRMMDNSVLVDVLRTGLNVVFCGTAAGRASAVRGSSLQVITACPFNYLLSPFMEPRPLRTCHGDSVCTTWSTD